MKEEKVERTDIWQGEFSPTGVETAFCYRKIYLKKVLGLVEKKPAYALWFGAAIHKGVEAYYVNRPSLSWEQTSQLAVEAFVSSWIRNKSNGDSKRNLAGGIAIMGAYCDYYKDDVANIVPEFVEASQWIQMPNGTHCLMKIDRVRDDSSLYTVVDTKTSSWPLTDFYFRGYENNFQTSCYYHCVEEMLGECQAIQIDGIKVPWPGPDSKTVPFSRRTFLREELQIADALNTYCRMTDYIMENLGKYEHDEEKLLEMFYCNQTKCNDYGGCEYKPICMYGFSHPAVAVDFEVKKPERKGEVQ
jgi:hypothetical protein